MRSTSNSSHPRASISARVMAKNAVLSVLSNKVRWVVCFAAHENPPAWRVRHCEFQSAATAETHAIPFPMRKENCPTCNILSRCHVCFIHLEIYPNRSSPTDSAEEPKISAKKTRENSVFSCCCEAINFFVPNRSLSKPYYRCGALFSALNKGFRFLAQREPTVPTGRLCSLNTPRERGLS